MADLPDVFLSLGEDVNLARSPAFLVVDVSGTLVDCGGALAQYGVSGIAVGQKVLEQIPVLEGMLDFSEELLHLQSVQFQQFCVADLYVLKKKEQYWILFLDTTDKTAQQQMVQQDAYDAYFSQKDGLAKTQLISVQDREARSKGQLELKNMDGIDLQDVLPVLNVAWFERQDDGAFVFCGKAPEWLVLLYPEALQPDARLIPGDKFLFLEHFLEDAVPFWDGTQNGRLKSGLWQETADGGDDYLLEASALLVEGRQVLLIEGVDDESRRDLIQTAREKQLAYIRELQNQSQAVKDLTTEKELAETASKAKSEFLASMSHEIRTPMNSVLGYAQLLQTDPLLTDKQQRYLEAVERSGHHLMALINDILDLAKIEAGKEELDIKAFDLRTFAKEMGDMFQIRCDQKQLAWQLDGPSEELWVHGDERKLRQVVINLLGNAVKFTDDGTVGLTVKALDNERFGFEVHDTGPGIPKEKQSEVFEPFLQERQGKTKGGTGLGLAISQKLVELMGGDLVLDSALGEGTHFSFTLFLAAETVAALPETTANLNWRLDPKHQIHAVVVDDLAESREILGELLTHVGVEVDIFETGQDALDFMQTKLPDVVLLDVRMPGMNGLSTMLAIWKAFGRKEIPIVAVSASVLARERRRYLVAGFDAFLDKPVLCDALCTCLTDLLGVTFVEQS